MIKSTVIHLEPKDFNETFDQITFANYARYAKHETLEEIEQADLALNGDDVIIGAAVSDEDAKTLFPQGWKTVKPYLRVLAQPK